ncbi:DUF4129 domain-containing protein [Actinotalea sp. M2MS4P-6]|uniref:DUF4129 domain-containing protein n=1 Tax=Actinotalea sp. M2MS4P-6 TaxID=2983762 RepID=UPI0021E4E8B6|nr:DUF4129 domain-containing protein [Actinotalea sp. M2MS4P-6]MCV2394148.1 DUF4129 domain-containing protein [Actinotalea sp. M2MS4P-6]
MTFAVAAAVLLDVPVDPDADQARAWLEAELLDPIYHEQPSLLQRFLDWLLEQLGQAQQALGAIDQRAAALVTVVVVAVVVVIALLVAGPIRRARRAARVSHEVLVDDTRTAAQLRADAEKHAAAGRWADAVLDRFRAILRSLEERAVLDPRPGRTADEAASVASQRFPSLADDLTSAGRLFDDVCYGDLTPDADAAAWMRDLDQAVTRTRPVAPEPAAVG